MTEFRARTDAFLSEFLALQPTAATMIGEHAYDARWPDMSAAGRRELIAFADRWLAELQGFTDLSDDDAVDRDLLVQQLHAMRFADLELREEAWNPLEWVYLLGGGLFGLISREFAPLAERLESVAGRLDGIRGGGRCRDRGDRAGRGAAGGTLPHREGARAAAGRHRARGGGAYDGAAGGR